MKRMKKIEIKTPIEITALADPVCVIENVYEIAATPLIEPQTHKIESETPVEQLTPEESKEKFITYNELQMNRATNDELKECSAFKNYKEGDPSMRLYIKNLSRQVTDKDMRYIYGRYIDWSLESHRISFDVRVMQQGRMKGQGFVGLPSEQIASTALNETHGYKLYDRPMIVQFARSTKAKEVSTLIE
jgi:U11/U12 small nuclear ribonucleoprotein SNRNP65